MNKLKKSEKVDENPICPRCGAPMHKPPAEYTLGDRCASCGVWNAVALIDDIWTWVEYPLDIDVYLNMWEEVPNGEQWSKR